MDTTRIPRALSPREFQDEIADERRTYKRREEQVSGGARGKIEDSLEYAVGAVPAIACQQCGGLGVIWDEKRKELCFPLPCDHCRAIGYFGIDPTMPTTAIPGSYAKMAVLAARERAKLPLYDPSDACDSEPIYMGDKNFRKI